MAKSNSKQSTKQRNSSKSDPDRAIYSAFAFVRKAASLADAARNIEDTLDLVAADMKQLVTRFHKRFPPRVGFEGGYTLVLIRCGSPGCRLCPHSVKWRRYDCVRKNHDLNIVRPPIKSKFPYLENMAIKSQFLGTDVPGSAASRNKDSRRTSIIWGEKRLATLPAPFHKKHKNKKWFQEFIRFNEEVKLLNARRKLLGDFYRKIMLMHNSLNNTIFQTYKQPIDVQTHADMLDHRPIPTYNFDRN